MLIFYCWLKFTFLSECSGCSSIPRRGPYLVWTTFRLYLGLGVVGNASSGRKMNRIRAWTRTFGEPNSGNRRMAQVRPQLILHAAPALSFRVPKPYLVTDSYESVNGTAPRPLPSVNLKLCHCFPWSIPPVLFLRQPAFFSTMVWFSLKQTMKCQAQGLATPEASERGLNLCPPSLCSNLSDYQSFLKLSQATNWFPVAIEILIIHILMFTTLILYVHLISFLHLSPGN